MAATTVGDMSGITYLKGDATAPQAKGVKLIVHVCNDLGGWGKGFVPALSRRTRVTGGTWRGACGGVVRQGPGRARPPRWTWGTDTE